MIALDRKELVRFALLRIAGLPPLAVFIAASAISSTGTWIQRVAVGWLSWDLSHSSAWVGTIAIADLAPILLFSVLGGAVADRQPPLAVLRLSQVAATLQSFILFGLAAMGLLSLWSLFALSAVLGITNAFNPPARQAVVEALVGRANIARALAGLSLGFNLARFFGPAIAGPLIVTAGVGAAFLANTVSFVGFLAVLWCLPAIPETARPAAKSSLLADARAGFGYAAKTPAIAGLLLLILATSLLARPYTELLPAIAAQFFQGGPQALALLTSSQGLGAILGGLWLLKRRDGPSLALQAFAGALALSLAALMLSASGPILLAIAAIAAAGCAQVVQSVGTQSLLRMIAIPTMQGRVVSIFSMIFQAAPTSGAFIMGLLAEVISLRTVLGIGAVLTMLSWFALASRWHVVRAASDNLGATRQPEPELAEPGSV